MNFASQGATRSIRRKISILIAATVGATMTLVSLIDVWHETRSSLRATGESLHAAASAFAAASAPAAASRDRALAIEALRGIGTLAHLEFARLQDIAGREIASIGSGVRLSRDITLRDGNGYSSLDLLTSRSLAYTIPVRNDGRKVGELTLVKDISDLRGHLNNQILLRLAASAVATLIALLLSYQLQRAILRPLSVLLETIVAIREHHDYDRHVPLNGQDEVGTLARSFNELMDVIKERDERLLAHQAKLEQEVRDRTSDMMQARDEAEAANQAKSTFLATMSHEIRTPMSGLLVMAELLTSSELPGRANRYAEVIHRSGTALLSIINDILDFSKIEAGKLEIEEVPLAPRTLVNTVLNLFYAKAREKGLDLAAHVGTCVPETIEGDPARLQQILSNLVNNAIKFTTAGHVLIGVKAEGGRLMIEVVDTGIGIPSDKCARIFEAFSQADSSTTREFGGTGLGLTICRRLADAMGGTVEVESTVGAGSTFRCLVPLRPLEPASISPKAPAQSIRVFAEVGASGAQAALSRAFIEGSISPATDRTSANLIITDDATIKDVPTGTRILLLSPPEAPERTDVFQIRLPFNTSDFERAMAEALDPDHGSRKRLSTTALRPRFSTARVLVVDDAEVNREVMIEALARFGITPGLATNGQEALDVAATTRFDLILMDGSMPVLNGFEATRRLRQTDGINARTPVVALTAHVVGLQADAWKSSGMQGVLYKPFQMIELQGVLEAYLAPAEHVAEQTTPAPEATPATSSSAETAAPILDETVMRDIAGAGGASGSFAKRVFGLYISQAPTAWANISAAAASGDYAAMAKAAHALKSMSYNIGAAAVAAEAREIEASAKSEANPSILLPKLESALALTLELLNERLRSTSQSAAEAASA